MAKRERVIDGMDEQTRGVWVRLVARCRSALENRLKKKSGELGMLIGFHDIATIVAADAAMIREGRRAGD